MVRRLKVAPVKKKKKDRLSDYMVAFAKMGPEPSVAGKALNDTELSRCYTWYSYMEDRKRAMEYLATFLEQRGQPQKAALVRTVSENAFPPTVGWVARLLTNGAILSDRTKEFFLDRIRKILELARKQNSGSTTVAPPTDTTRERANELIGHIEAEIDRGRVFDIYEFLQKRDVPIAHCSHVINYYLPKLSEMYMIRERANRDLNEAFGKIAPKKLEAAIKFWETFLAKVEKYATDSRTVRDPKPVKALSPEKQTEKLIFKRSDTRLGLRSIDPLLIVGAKELWTYNTVYKLITVLRSPTGLSVHRMKIKDYDEKDSGTYRGGRIAEMRVREILSVDKSELRDKTKGLISYSMTMGKINENTILLRVVR